MRARQPVASSRSALVFASAVLAPLALFAACTGGADASTCEVNADCDDDSFCHSDEFGVASCLAYPRAGEPCYGSDDTLLACHPDDDACCVAEDVGGESNFGRCTRDEDLIEGEASVCY